MTHKEIVALYRAYVAQAEAFPRAYPEACFDLTQDCPCPRGDDSQHRYDEGNDANICLVEERSMLRDMADAAGSYVSVEDRAANTCPRCGTYGMMKHGDENDCRSADCLSAKVDAAMDLMEDR